MMRFLGQMFLTNHLKLMKVPEMIQMELHIAGDWLLVDKSARPL